MNPQIGNPIEDWVGKSSLSSGNVQIDVLTNNSNPEASQIIDRSFSEGSTHGFYLYSIHPHYKLRESISDTFIRYGPKEFSTPNIVL